MAVGVSAIKASSVNLLKSRALHGSLLSLIECLVLVAIPLR